MRLAREMERRLERLVDGASAVVFRGRMHPVDMAERLIRQADFLVSTGAAGAEIPNRWMMAINPLDVPEGVDREELDVELAAALGGTARERAWRVGGPITVDIVIDEEVPRGLVDCSGRSEPGPLPAWGQLISTTPPLALDIGDNRSLLGRAPEADLMANIPEVSRRQALIVRQGSTVTISDSGSANGTFVNGELVAAPLPIIPGDVVTIGDVDFTFRLL